MWSFASWISSVQIRGTIYREIQWETTPSLHPSLPAGSVQSSCLSCHPEVTLWMSPILLSLSFIPKHLNGNECSPLRGNIFTSKSSKWVISNISHFCALGEEICRDQPFAVTVSDFRQSCREGRKDQLQIPCLNSLNLCCSSSLIPVAAPAWNGMCGPETNPKASSRAEEGLQSTESG